MRWLTDENFNGTVLQGMVRRNPKFEVVRAQDAGMTGWEDPDLLEWAAQQGRLILTHDMSTLTGFAYARIRQGRRTSGVFQVRDEYSIGRLVEDIVIIDECSTPEEWESQVVYLPL